MSVKLNNGDPLWVCDACSKIIGHLRHAHYYGVTVQLHQKHQRQKRHFCDALCLSRHRSCYSKTISDPYPEGWIFPEKKIIIRTSAEKSQKADLPAED